MAVVPVSFFFFWLCALPSGICFLFFLFLLSAHSKHFRPQGPAGHGRAPDGAPEAVPTRAVSPAQGASRAQGRGLRSQPSHGDTFRHLPSGNLASARCASWEGRGDRELLPCALPASARRDGRAGEGRSEQEAPTLAGTEGMPPDKRGTRGEPSQTPRAVAEPAFAGGPPEHRTRGRPHAEPRGPCRCSASRSGPRRWRRSRGLIQTKVSTARASGAGLVSGKRSPHVTVHMCVSLRVSVFLLFLISRSTKR